MQLFTVLQVVVEIAVWALSGLMHLALCMHNHAVVLFIMCMHVVLLGLSLFLSMMIFYYMCMLVL